MYRRIDSLRDYAVNLLMELIRRPAVNPDYGGEGEYEKAMYLYNVIKDWGFDDIRIINAPDPRAKGGVRPNILAYIKGHSDKKLWILTHLDVVPPGDLSAWTVTKPFEPIVRDGKVYGRGAEDNGQAMVSSLIAAKALLDEGLKPSRTVVLAFVSDEEAGSKYGIYYLIEKYPELFSKEDEALVPDYGSGDGSVIEVAEKSILWLRLRIKGVQVHASTPHKGVNPHRVAADYIMAIDKLLKEKYSGRNNLFDPPTTTCEPTMVRNPSTSPNIIPGEHEVVMDCRLLPEHSIDEFLEDLKKVFNEIASKHEKNVEGVKYPQLSIEIIQRSDAPPPTPVEAPIVQTLMKALQELRGIKPRVIGIGGGTVAAFFRRLGISAAVWSTIDEVAHQPNEYAKIDNMVNDAKVMAYLMLNLKP
ncbi:MAG: M20 family metallo-hydrolase [Ignisphaera sp.]|nr:M20 family metallo-hydrolase [Ignisphaera sp.]